VALGSPHQDLRAAAKKTADKVQKYHRALESLGFGDQALLPFVVEATGRLSEQALTWISTIASGQHHKDFNFFVDRLNTTLARYHAELDRAYHVEALCLPTVRRGPSHG